MVTEPTTFVPIHAAGDGAWSWGLVSEELRALGHEVVAIDLPEDPSAGLWDYADTVVGGIGTRQNVVLVAHSFGGFTAPLVCLRMRVQALVMVSAMIPTPGEAPADWWTSTRHADAHAAADDDDYATYYHDVPRPLADEAIRRSRDHPSDRAYREVWPLAEWPEVRTHAVLCLEDRLFPADWMRGLIGDRLGLTPDEIRSGHCPMLSVPADFARLLATYAHIDDS
jgi:pimeloyl-ACP methyl ester carboxylesterase